MYIWKRGSRVSWYVGIEGDTPKFARQVFAESIPDEHIVTILAYLRKQFPFDEFGVIQDPLDFNRKKCRDEVFPRITQRIPLQGELELGAHERVSENYGSVSV